MRLEIFSVFDIALGAFGRPMFLNSVGQAMRSFSDEVNRKSDDNNMYRHPEDFALFHCGTWVDDDGSFEVFDRPQRLTNAVDVLVKEN
ncbi:MAG: nonstructural protein [Microviridae sp.]|nr:MAG: nonstructural protein [Microviridae sp.]